MHKPFTGSAEASFDLFQRVVVVLVVVREVPGTPGVVSSVPSVSFSIMTPARSEDRFTVVVSST